jgi:hypothetical protein
MHVSSRNMFSTIRNLQIRVHVYCPHHCCGDWLTFGCFVPMIANHDLVKKSFGPIMTSWRKDKQPWILRYTRTHSWQWLLRNTSVSCRVNQFFFCNYSYVVHTEYIYFFFFINWTLRMSDNLPERVQILCHAHIICITALENRIICCQIFCDLLLKSAFEQIFNVMQLILVIIKWHIKWKYWIQKFHDICLSYYFKEALATILTKKNICFGIW